MRTFVSRRRGGRNFAWSRVTAFALIAGVGLAGTTPALAQENHAPLGVYGAAGDSLQNALRHHNQGYAYARLGYYQPAIDEYSAAIQLAPHLATAYANRSMAYREIGESELAIEDAATSMSMDHQMVAKWQGWMNQLGFYSASIDGLQGPATNEAIIRWAYKGYPPLERLAQQ